MNTKTYINKILLLLSDKYKFNLIETKTYKQHKKFSNFKLVIYKYNEDSTEYYKTIECKSEMELLLKLKEMI